MTTIITDPGQLLVHWNPANLAEAMEQARHVHKFDKSLGCQIHLDSERNGFNLLVIYNDKKFLCRPDSRLKILKTGDGGLDISVSEITHETYLRGFKMEEVCTCNQKCPGDIGFIEDGKIYHSACNQDRAKAFVVAAGGLDKVTEFRVWVDEDIGWVDNSFNFQIESPSLCSDPTGMKIIGALKPYQGAVKVKISEYKPEEKP